jgi:hypothetical protein
MRYLQAWFVTFLLLATAGCASLEGKKPATSTSDAKAGLAYYLTRPVYTIEVKDRRDNKPADPVYDLKVGFAPDLNERYEVNLKNGWLTNDSLSLQMLDDGRLASINAKSESQLPEVIKSLGSLAASAVSLAAAATVDAAKDLDIAYCAQEVTVEEYTLASCALQEFKKKQPSSNPTCSFDVQCPNSQPPTPSPITVSLDEKNLNAAAKTVNKMIDRREHRIVKRFEDGEFASQVQAKAAEAASFADYEAVLRLHDFATKINDHKPQTPREQIGLHLQTQRQEAEKQYALFVQGKIDEATFLSAVKDYQMAVDRFLAFDERFEKTGALKRQAQLAEFLSRDIPPPPGPTGKNSKAFADYRAELDRVTQEMTARLAAVTEDKKKQDALLPGTEITRKLDKIVTCTICSSNQIFESDQRLLKLADLWIKYGKKDAVVFQASDSGALKVECDSFFNSSAQNPACKAGGQP